MSAVNAENAPIVVSKRRSLQSIQAVSQDSRLLTRSMASKTSTKTSTAKRADKESKREKTERITKWLTQKEAIDDDVKYWKCLAKERAKALEASLKENQELSEANDRLREQLQEVSHERDLLDEENKHLSRLAEEGVKLKDLLQEYID